MWVVHSRLHNPQSWESKDGKNLKLLCNAFSETNKLILTLFCSGSYCFAIFHLDKHISNLHRASLSNSQYLDLEERMSKSAPPKPASRVWTDNKSRWNTSSSYFFSNVSPFTNRLLKEINAQSILGCYILRHDIV